MSHVLHQFLRYKDIIFYRTLAGLKSEARKNYLGYLWFVLEPLLATAVLYFAMSHLTGQRGATAVLTILVGMAIWQWFEGSVMMSAGSISAKYHVHQQVPLPKYLFPLVDVCTHTVRFLFAYTIILTACLLLGPAPTAALVWLPMLLSLQLAFIISVSLMISLLVTLLPDLRFLIQSLFRLLFFLSGVFFSAERVPADLLGLFHLNPVTIFIESNRAVILGGAAPDIALLWRPLAFTITLFAVGLALHSHYDKRLLKLINV